MQTRATLHVDLAALAHNYRYFAGLSPGGCAATVKANAYGLGLERVATTLWDAGCRIFFVARLFEGEQLRAIVPDAQIHVFDGLSLHQPQDYLSARLFPVLNNHKDVQRWADASPPPGAALHIDTAMNRLGCSDADARALAADADLQKDAGLRLLMTHLACADTPEHLQNARQLQRYEAWQTCFAQLQPSYGNSAGSMNGVPEHSLNRPGIGLYGGNPRPEHTSPLRAVARLTAPILQIRALKAGDDVGYGSTYRAPGDITAATVAIGYADGIPRHLSPDARLYIGKHGCAVIGRISMDTLVIDASDVPQEMLQPGQSVDIIGTASLDTFAGWAGTISYEVLTSISPRVARNHAHRA